MKILVPIKRVIDYNLKVRVRDDHADVDLTNLKMAINPFCEIALEEAVRLKEQGVADEIVAVSIGPEQAQEQLRGALALGADRAMLLQCDRMPGPLAVAKLLQALVLRESPELVLLGKQSIDSDNNQVTQMLGALLDWPQALFASEVRMQEQRLQVTCEVDGGLRTQELGLPAVVSVDLRLNEPRFASLPNIMQAKRKPLEVVDADTFGIDLTGQLELVEVVPPPKRQGGSKVADVDELIDQFRNHAKVIS